MVRLMVGVLMVTARRRVLATDAELRGADTGPRDPLSPDSVGGNRQTAQRRPDIVERDTGVDERAENHVAGSSRRTVEVERRQDDHLTLPSSSRALPRSASS